MVFSQFDFRVYSEFGLIVFLQQLGRWLRHTPEKKYLTVLDFVGQEHSIYRMDTRVKVLLPRDHHSIDKEVETISLICRSQLHWES